MEVLQAEDHQGSEGVTVVALCGESLFKGVIVQVDFHEVVYHRYFALGEGG